MSAEDAAGSGGGRSGRRELGLVALVWAVAAGVLALAARATWGSTGGTALLPPEPVSGPPVAAALGVAALAAAACLPLLRGGGRRVLGAVGGVLGVAALAAVLTARPAGSGWSWLAGACALTVAAAGAVTVVRAGRWPGTGRRFARPSGTGQSGTAPPDARPATRPGADPSGTGQSGTAPPDARPATRPGADPSCTASGAASGTSGATGSREVWDALDRGEDPTA